MKKNNYFAAELARMPYLWFLKESFIKTVKFKHFFIQNENLNFIFNIILFPFLFVLFPIVSFFTKQLCQDLSNYNNPVEIKNYATFSEQNVVLYRDENNNFKRD